MEEEFIHGEQWVFQYNETNLAPVWSATNGEHKIFVEIPKIFMRYRFTIRTVRKNDS
jgi:hypothetical protein